MSERLAPIIGLSGRMSSGKDTAAEVLVEHYGYKQFAFADAMRDAALALDPIVDMWLDEDGFRSSIIKGSRLSEVVNAVGWRQAKDTMPEVRRTLERLGTEVGRNLFGTNFWIDQTFKAIAEYGGAAVITDVRFPNEARAVEKIALGYLIRIERPSLEGVAGSSHISESALDDYDFEEIVVNDGTIQHLHNEIAAYAIALDTLLTQA